MLKHPVRLLVLLLPFLLLGGVCGVAQSTSAVTVKRMEGVDAPSGIVWVQLAIEGSFVAKDAAPATPPPTLTAQCTQTKAGKQKFELLGDFGGITDRAYYPPWRPANSDDLFPPRLDKVTVTMDFLGYTHVKPAKRQWSVLMTPYGELQYNAPGSGSANLEEIMYYLRYLLALPTLRLSAPGRQTVDFMMTPLLDAIRKEPMCKAGGL
jgi:hypothetical protein